MKTSKAMGSFAIDLRYEGVANAHQRCLRPHTNKAGNSPTQTFRLWCINVGFRLASSSG